MSSFPACVLGVRIICPMFYGGTEIKYKLSDEALSVGKTLGWE